MPIYPGNVCSICSESINLTWICPECHQVFCDDCVNVQTEDILVCLDCNGREFEENRHGVHICKLCGSQNVQIGKNVFTECRNCGSRKILRIIDLQDQLITRYKQIINQTRAFAAPIKNAVELLNSLRTKLYQLRHENPPALHYPNLEQELFMVVNLMDNVKNELSEQVFHYFQIIQRNIHYIKEIRITHPENLSYINEILEYFERERKKVEQSAQSRIEHLSTKLERIETQITLMGSVQANFIKYMNKLKLDPEEKIVFVQNCKLSNGKNSDDAFSNKNGTIMLTSKRLYFLHEHGLFRKQTAVLFRIKLEDIENAGVKGKLIKKVSLESLNSMYNFKLPKEDRDNLLDWIERARKFDHLNQVDKESWQRLNRVKINATLFQEQLEQTIYELIGFHGTNGTSPGNDPSRVINQGMFRTQNLPSQNGSSSYARYQNNSSNGSNYSQYRYSNYPRNPNSNQNSYGGSYRDPQQRSYSPQPNSSWNSKSQTFKYQSPEYPPTGEQPHFGYPHDKRPRSNYFADTSPNPRTTFQFQNDDVWKPYSNRTSSPSTNQSWRKKIRFNSPSYDSFNQYEDPWGEKRNSSYQRDPRTPKQFDSQGSYNNQSKTRNTQFYQNFQQNDPSSFRGSNPSTENYAHPPSPERSGSRTPFSNYNPTQNSSNSTDFTMGDQEMEMQSELHHLREEEYSLQQTQQMVEQRYKSGQISHENFMKDYQEIQRQHFKVVSQINELEKVLAHNFV